MAQAKPEPPIRVRCQSCGMSESAKVAASWRSTRCPRCRREPPAVHTTALPPASPGLPAPVLEWLNGSLSRMAYRSGDMIELRIIDGAEGTRVASLSELEAVRAIQSGQINWRTLPERRALTTNNEAVASGADGVAFYGRGLF